MDGRTDGLPGRSVTQQTNCESVIVCVCGPNLVAFVSLKKVFD